MLILNIGHDQSSRFTTEPGAWSSEHVLNAVQSALAGTTAEITGSKVEQSDTEETSVIYLKGLELNEILDATARLATSLKQDCIAVYCTETNTGTLVGRYADAWGQFDMNYFLV